MFARKPVSGTIKVIINSGPYFPFCPESYRQRYRQILMSCARQMHPPLRLSLCTWIKEGKVSDNQQMSYINRANFTRIPVELKIFPSRTSQFLIPNSLIPNFPHIWPSIRNFSKTDWHAKEIWIYPVHPRRV